MRFMLLMIPKGYERAQPGAMPDATAVAAMAKFNKAMQEAGALLSLDGLHPPAEGARVIFSHGRQTVIHGPFTNTAEALGGYWIITAKSQDEAVAWAMRCPVMGDATIEVRRIQEMSDFPEDVRKAAAG